MEGGHKDRTPPDSHISRANYDWQLPPHPHHPPTIGDNCNRPAGTPCPAGPPMGMPPLGFPFPAFFHAPYGMPFGPALFIPPAPCAQIPPSAPAQSTSAPNAEVESKRAREEKKRRRPKKEMKKRSPSSSSSSSSHSSSSSSSSSSAPTTSQMRKKRTAKKAPASSAPPAQERLASSSSRNSLPPDGEVVAVRRNGGGRQSVSPHRDNNQPVGEPRRPRDSCGYCWLLNKSMGRYSHHSKNCWRLVTADERRHCLLEHGMCERCMEPLPMRYHAPERMRYGNCNCHRDEPDLCCDYCELSTHHTSICYDYIMWYRREQNE